ncbi:SapC family protein [Massilia glaciei]|nr:SapC family protein [Massilia glaciei]
MIFYERPAALNRERHRNLKLDNTSGDFSFAGRTNSILLAVTEMTEAAKDYPIVFTGKEGGPFTLAALVGLRDSENLFVGANGVWQEGVYLPAFVRRYPFVLAEAEGGGEDLTVCIDESYAGLNTERGDPLFGEGGAESPLLEGAVAFLTLFHTEMQQTRLFAQTLSDAGLLDRKSIEVNRGGQKQVLEGIFVVDQQKLAALDDAQVLALFRSGALVAIHAHLMSLTHVERLAQRMDQRMRAPAKPESEAAARGAPAQRPAKAGKGERSDKRASAQAPPQ